MLYAFIIVLVIAIGLAVGLYFQIKASRGQAAEQQQLLTDYQSRVDEQQKLLDDYRALEKNFDNIGEGYEQALLSFDKMQEESQKSQATISALQQRCDNLLRELETEKDKSQKKEQVVNAVFAEVESKAKASGDSETLSLLNKISDQDELAPDQAPYDRDDNVLLVQVSDEAIKESGIDTAQYLTFNYDVAPDAAATMLSTNLPKAVRALTHLLDNAKKFTTEGSVRLGVTVDMDKMQVSYTIEDTGSGIDAADVERIFEPYVKLNQFFDGDGVGLTVSRNIARRLGGDVVLDTTFEGPGSRFVLTLPM